MIWKHSKNDTWSSLQKCHSMHRPRNNQFFRWTLLAISLCKIMDTVAIHSIQLLDYSRNTMVTELRSICEELELNWSFFLQIVLSHFSVMWPSKVSKISRLLHLLRPPRCRYRTSNSCSLFFELRSHFYALFIGCSSKEEGHIILNGSKSLFLHWFCL